MRNRLFIISGPSGVGKGTLVKLLIEEDKTLALSVSCTTRSPRTGETDGKDYFFISKEEFLSRMEQDGFLESDEHFGNFYGTPKSFVAKTLCDRSVILEIDVVGALNVRNKCKEEFDPVLIFIAAPDEKELRARLAGRCSEDEVSLKGRLLRADYENSLQSEYDYIVVNDDLQEAKARLQAIIHQEKNRE